jgi:hypothetical protein
MHNMLNQPEHDMTLFPFQMEIFQSDERFKIVAAGRRTGKSHLCCVSALDQCTRLPNQRVIMVGPTYGQAREAFWTTLKTLCHRSWLQQDPMEGSLELRFINGSRITLKGADRPDTLRGISPSPTRIILDEYAYFKSGVFDEVILPMTSDPVRKADIWIISTPKGIGNHFYELYERGQDRKFPDWRSWQFAAEDVRPDMSEEIALAKSTLDSRAFDQEYRASFLNTGDAVFHQFDRQIHVRDDLESFATGEAVHVSIDFNVSIMAAAAFALRGNQIHYLWESEGAANTDALCDVIKRDFPNRKIYVYPDPSGRARKSSAAFSVTDFSILRDAGFEVRARKAHPSIKDSANAVNRLLCDANGNTNLFFDKHLTNVLRSIEGTQWKSKANSEDMDSAQIDKNAGTEHHSDHVRYAVDYLFPIRHGQSGVRQGSRF